MADDLPVGDGELAGLFAPLARFDAVALAVSGGSDSTALLRLAARWRERCEIATALTVLTVDHGLRSASRMEAEVVAEQAAQLGLVHRTLVWEGQKPVAGIQAAARQERYRLLTSFARAHRIDAVVTAHTRDDQAETLLMRLARGSGLDGLAAMQPESAFEGIAILRPLLDVPKARLVVTLRAADVAWTEDPSNENRQFERVRLRDAAPVLDTLGLTAAMLATSARRLARAGRALDHYADRALHDGEIATVSPLGYVTLSARHLAELPEEIVVRILRRSVAGVGGRQEPTSLAAIEDVAASLLQPGDGARTLGGCQIVKRAADILVLREEGRQDAPEVDLQPGVPADFDGRFAVSVTVPGLILGRAGAEGARRAREGLVPDGVPRQALVTMPGLFAAGSAANAPPRLVALPATRDPDAVSLGCRCRFYGLSLPGGMDRRGAVGGADAP